MDLRGADQHPPTRTIQTLSQARRISKILGPSIQWQGRIEEVCGALSALFISISTLGERDRRSGDIVRLLAGVFDGRLFASI